MWFFEIFLIPGDLQAVDFQNYVQTLLITLSPTEKIVKVPLHYLQGKRKHSYRMATIPENEGLELKSVTSSEQKEKPKQAKSDYKRTHSYPEDKKSVIKKAHHHKSHGSHPEMIQRMQSRGPLTVAVFLVEKAVRLLNLEDGKSATAGSMAKIMRETLSLPAEAEKAFCIWLKSPLLRKYSVK